MSRLEVIRTVGSLFRDARLPSVRLRRLSVKYAEVIQPDDEPPIVDPGHRTTQIPSNPREVPPTAVRYRPPASDWNTAYWRINGHLATIFIWTEAEWDNLADRPADAQYYPCGVWCALRMNPN